MAKVFDERLNELSDDLEICKIAILVRKYLRYIGHGLSI